MPAAHARLICLLLAAAAPRAQGAELLPVETFARDYAYTSVRIAPDGRRIALTFPSRGSTNLAVIDLEASKPYALTGFETPDEVTWFGWKTETRLIFRAIGHDSWNPRVAVLDAIDSDGRNRVSLVQNPLDSGRYVYEYVLDWLPEEPDRVLVVSDAEISDQPAVYRVAIQRESKRLRASGGGPGWPTARQKAAPVPGRECDYTTDLNGVVRACLTHEEDNSSKLFYRTGNDGDWMQLAHFPADSGDIFPVAFAPDNRRMYVFSNVERNTYGLFLYDPDRRVMGDLLFEANGVDLDEPVFAGDGRRLIGVRYEARGPGVHYIDPDAERLHLAMNKAFAGMQTELVSYVAPDRRMIVWVGSPQTPGSYYLYEPAKGTVSPVAAIAPWIDPARMGTVRAAAFSARDGLKLEGYLTLPGGVAQEKLPLIVNVHGGPHGVREVATFDRDSQFFASRGYAVLNLNFRGSGGYGRDFRAAGFGEWGGKMQTDIVDAVKTLVDEGLADPARVGIYGGSYGGYAAMLAAATSPDLFRCAITYAGVFDLLRMLDQKRVKLNRGLVRFIGHDERRFWEQVIGNRNDEAALRAISPLYQAAKVVAPVLIAHGRDDLTVPVGESIEMHAALAKAGKKAEILLLPGEGHGFSLERNRLEFYRRVDAFLASHLPARP